MRVRWLQGTGAKTCPVTLVPCSAKRSSAVSHQLLATAQRADETGSTGNPEWRRPLWAAGDPGAPVEMTAAYSTRQRRKGRCEDGRVAQPVVPSRPSPTFSSALFSYPTAEDSWQNPLLPTAKMGPEESREQLPPLRPRPSLLLPAPLHHPHFRDPSFPGLTGLWVTTDPGHL